MLRVKTYIASDRFGGRGVFAADLIPAGTVVWKFHPNFTKFIPADRVLRLPESQRDWLATYSYPFVDEDTMPVTKGVFYNLDDSRFMNHDERPNTGYPPGEGEVNIAVRDIQKGEELTCDYHDFDPGHVLYGMGIRTCTAFLIDMPKRKAVS
jgi:SET domain-containing protein